MEEGDGLTVIRTSRVHLTMPMFPPLTCTGAEVEARSWSRNLSKSISKVNVGWPAVSTCIVAMSRHSEGYERSSKGVNRVSSHSIEKLTGEMNVARPCTLRFNCGRYGFERQMWFTGAQTKNRLDLKELISFVLVQGYINFLQEFVEGS